MHRAPLLLPLALAAATSLAATIGAQTPTGKTPAAADSVAHPCRHDARFREFDFWVGDWDVRPTGRPPAGPAARNTITVDEDGCVLTEHWSSPSGSAGRSFNLFDRSYGQWRQTWVDNAGGQHDYRGRRVGNDMVFVGDTPAPGGLTGRVPTRLTFFRLGPDSVRQFSEISPDSGRTWRVAYDLTYVRRRSAQRDALGDGDRAAIRALDSAFVGAWLRDDTTAVLALFADDAVLLPPGARPVAGHPAIRAWWWPTDGSRTRILAFDHVVDEIGGTRELAFVRGTSTLRWRSTKAGTTTTQTSRSTDLRLVARDADGRWRIVRQMWSPLP